MSPTLILSIWLTGLLPAGVGGGGVYLTREWYQRSWSFDLVLQQAVFSPEFGWNEATMLLGGAVLLFLIATIGRSLVRWLLSSKTNARREGTERDESAPNRRVKERRRHRLERSEGSELQMKLYGREDAPPLILTHGWGLDSTAWDYVKRELSRRFRLIVWDQPGLNLSTRPSNRDFSLEKLAGDLQAVLAFADNRAAIRAGHSIGGMIVLTLPVVSGRDRVTRIRPRPDEHDLHEPSANSERRAVLHRDRNSDS